MLLFGARATAFTEPLRCGAKSRSMWPVALSKASSDVRVNEVELS
jgi:hypothetical protein